MRLDIGGGNNPLPDYLSVDAFTGADVQAYMWALPFADGSVDEIYSSHALEHISKFQVVPTLEEWARVIKAEGRIIIRVPDLEWCVNKWLETKGDGWDMAIIFGSQTQDDGISIHEGEFHKTGFTRGLMLGYLRKAGLTLFRYEDLWTHEQKTMSFECMKG